MLRLQQAARLVDYPDAHAGLSKLSSVGSLVFAIGRVVFFVNVALAFRRKQAAGDNPWGVGATTLEWTLTSPPPFCR